MEKKKLINNAKADLFEIYDSLTETQKANLFSLSSDLIRQTPWHVQEQD